ncbi:MAG: hypothetical protein ACNA8P_05450 [Phycisphaerales bacterium]
MARPAPIPRWFAITYTAFVVVLVPFYSVGYGFANFLWFSNIALISTVLTVWLHWRLLASMQLVSIGLLEMAWTIDVVAGFFIADGSLIGLAAYMYDDEIPLHLRLLSLYHLFLPWILLWLVWRLGYDERGWKWQTVLAWSVLLVCYLVTDPQDNINWTFGLGNSPQDVMPSWLYLLLMMVAYPVAVYFPTHLVVRRVVGWLEGKLGRGDGELRAASD